ncbi:MFS transporter [Streptosporangium sp. NPDC000396]|uniref:MFS transporter n=1 Tax=Streptosporangium sp. NPDC000396 TaxID=3366185 RepID=UPI0036B2FF00
MTVADAPKAGRREWVGLAVLALPTFLVAIDIFVLLLALPHLSAALKADSTQQLWVMDIYGFMLAGFLVTMGTLGDRIGRRKLLLIGATAFGIASVLTAFSTSPQMLIASRALLGIAGATLMPSTLALITNMFHDPKQRATAFGLWGGTFTLGALVGPIIGGFLMESFWWGAVFLLAVPLLLLLLILGPIVLPEYRNDQAGRLDPASVVLSLATMLPIIWGIKELARGGWQPLPVAAIVIGVIAAVAFGRRQRRLSDPLLDLGLFGNRSFSTALISQLCYSVVGGGTMLFMMLYFQAVGGMSTLQAGFAMLPGMAAATAGFMVAPILASRFRPAYVIAAGMTGTAAVLVAFTQVGATSGTALLIIGFAVFSFCGAPLVALGTNLVVGSAPPEKAGSAGSLAQMSNEFGGTLGGALLGTIGFALYRSHVAGTIPATVPADAAEAARDSIAGAAAAAGKLPEQLGAALLGPANEAFASALNAVTAIGAVVLAGVAVLIGTMLRHVPPIGQAAPAPGGEDGQADAVAPVAASSPSA